MSIIQNLKKRGLKDILSVSKWVLYSRAKVRQDEGTTFGSEGINIKNEDVISYIEQVIYRKDLCIDCFQKGECLHCGCKSPDLFLDKDMVCSGNNFQEMMSKEDWEIFKVERNIKIGVIYG